MGPDVLGIRPFTLAGLFRPQVIDVGCNCCNGTFAVSAFRATIRRGRLKYCRSCRKCESKKQCARDAAAKAKDAPEAPADIGMTFNAWAGPVDRPFVGKCLIDARGLVNLTPLDQEEMT